MEKAVKPTAWLPNTVGFRFIAVLKDGTEVEDVVDLRDGLHYCVQFPNMKGWKSLPKQAKLPSHEHNF